MRIGGRPKLTTAARWGAGWDFAWPCVGVCEVGCDTRESVRHVRERVCDVCETESGFAALRAMCECLAALQNVHACSAKRQKRCVECAYTHTHTHTHTHTQLNKRRSDIISKNEDIISQHRLSAVGTDATEPHHDLLKTRDAHAHYYAHTDTEHIASQLDALQEEQIAGLQAQLRQVSLAIGVGFFGHRRRFLWPQA